MTNIVNVDIDVIDDIIENSTADGDVAEDETDIPAEGQHCPTLANIVNVDIIDIDDIVDNDNDVAEDETNIPAQGLPPFAITGSADTTENISCYRNTLSKGPGPGV